jgi:hypothetical protein
MVGRAHITFLDLMEEKELLWEVLESIRPRHQIRIVAVEMADLDYMDLAAAAEAAEIGVWEQVQMAVEMVAQELRIAHMELLEHLV